MLEEDTQVGTGQRRQRRTTGAAERPTRGLALASVVFFLGGGDGLLVWAVEATTTTCPSSSWPEPEDDSRESEAVDEKEFRREAMEGRASGGSGRGTAGGGLRG